MKSNTDMIFKVIREIEKISVKREQFFRGFEWDTH